MSKALVKKLASDMGLKVLPDLPQWEFRLEIKSESSDRLYVVARSTETGEWGCSCPGWAFKRGNKPRSCKHLKNMMPALELIAPSKQKEIR